MANGAGPGACPEILMTLRAGHPRLFLTPESLERLRREVRGDPALANPYRQLLAGAEAVLPQPPVEHKIVGPRMLDQSQRCRDRVMALALAHLLSGEAKYAARAVREMEAAAAMPDWNPPHFLDAAEMTAALAVGYDWLYHYMSEDQRAAVGRALREKGLEPGLACYRGAEKYGWWTRSAGNWNVVCSGGLALGALALADEDPPVAAELLEAGLRSVRPALADFGPEGTWRDGPTYWTYTVFYAALYMDALRTALGSMKGLEQASGLAESGMFRIAGLGPTGRCFNFADAGEEVGFAPAMLWLARTFGGRLYGIEEWTRVDGHPLGLVWRSFDARAASPLAADLALHKVTGVAQHSYFRRDEIGFFRSAWNDPRALWLAFKGTDGDGAHRHLDAGSFVLEALGQRWAVDLGPDDYDLPGYFADQRWTYYRLATPSHNTLLVGGENQAPKARAPIVAFQGLDGDARAVLDLSACYPMTRFACRGFAMLGGAAVLVQDELASESPVDVAWGMLTRASVEVAGAEVTLEQGGERLRGRILEPSGAVFETVAADPPPPQAQQPDVCRLIVRLPQKVTQLRLAVALWPDRGGAAVPTLGPVQPLAEWPGWFRSPPAGLTPA